MKPKLSLDYAGEGGNGMLGIGWRLAGLSSIQRCGRTVAQDGVNDRISYEKTDRLCLDGQRLLLVNLALTDDNYWGDTAEYRTEIESFSRIRATVVNGRRGFKIETKDGRILTYGNGSAYVLPVLGTPNSGAAALPPAAKSGARAWALDGAADRSGNFIRYAYDQDNTSGEHRIASIRYGGSGRSAHAAVSFVYAPRDDAWTRYLDETRADVRNRLVLIKSFVGDNLDGDLASGTAVNEYKLGYEYSPTSGRSLLATVTACARNPSSGLDDCLTPTRFDWGKPDSNKAAGFVSKGIWNGPRLSTYNPANQASANHPEYFAFSDFENHGLTDVLEKRVAPPRLTGDQVSDDRSVVLAPGTLRGQYRYFHNTGREFVEYPYNINVDGANVNFAVLDIGDFNGDGAPDLLAATQSAGTKICLSPMATPAGLPAAGGTITFTCTNQPTTGKNEEAELPTIVDVNGDGRVAHYGPYFPTLSSAVLCLSDVCLDDPAAPLQILTTGIQQTPSRSLLQPMRDYIGFSQMIDFTGVGRPTDVRWSQPYLWRSVDSDGTPSNFYEWLNPRAVVQLTDVRAPGSPLSTFTSYLYPEGPTTCTDQLSCMPYIFDYPAAGAGLSGDFNGSGYNGVLFGYMGIDASGYKLKPPEMTICVSTGRTLDCRVRQKYSAGSYVSPLAVADFVGDGAPAILATSVTFRPGGSPIRSGDLQVCRLTGDDTSGGASADDANMRCAPWGGLTYRDLLGSGNVAHDQMFFMDLLGTGRMQLMYYHAGSFVNGTWVDGAGWELFAPVDVARDYEALDRIVKVTNGLGATSSVQYEDGVTAGIVTLSGSQSTAYPQRLARAPGKLVGRLLTDNGVAGTRTVSYRYEDPAIDMSGRGSVGFAVVKAFDEQSGIVTSTQYAQSWPYLGMVTRVTTRSDANLMLQDIQHEFSVQQIAQANGASTLFPHSKKVTAQRRGAGDDDLGTTVTEETYGDGWGNLTASTKTITASAAPASRYVTSSATTYRNSADTWLIGLPTELVETRVDPSNAARTRTLRKDYSATTGLLSTEEVEPGNSTLARNLTYHRGSDSFGLVTGLTEGWIDPYTGTPQSRQTITTYDASGRYPATITNALGHIETHTYDSGSGVRTALKDANGLTTTWVVDGFGRVSRQIAPSQNETRRYRKRCDATCPAGAVLAEIAEQFRGGDRIASPTVAYADAAGHVVQTRSWGFDGRAIVLEQNYDIMGRVYEQFWPRFDGAEPVLQRRNRYDLLDRPVSIETVDEAGKARIATTTYVGFVTKWVNEKMQTRTETRNAAGLLEQVIDNLDGVTSFTYDPFGNLLTTTDPMKNKVGIAYDLLGRRTDLRDPDLGWIHYDVDPLGRVWKTTSPNQRALGTSTRTVFDKLDRMVERYESDLESHWIYDSAAYGVGQLAEAHTGKAVAKDYRRLHTYDPLGRPFTTTQMINGDTYVGTTALDIWGRLTQQRYRRNAELEKVFDYRYNDKGYLSHIERGGAALWRAEAQDAANRVLSAKLGNGLQQIRSFYAYTGLPEKVLLQTAAGGRRLEENYTFDALGNVSQRSQYWETQGFTELFTYEGLNRIETSEVVGQPIQRITYDASGNITSKSNVSSQPYQYPAAGGDRPHGVIGIAGLGNFDYDDNGNQKSAPGRTTAWSSFDMPMRLTKGGVAQNFVYGPEHQRVRMDRTDNSTALVYAGAQEVELSGGVATVKTYWPAGIGLEIDKPGQPTELLWTHTDRLGSVIGLTDAGGALKERLAYDPWGKRRNLDGASAPDTLDGKTDNRGFTGHEMLDALDLVHMNGRVYDPFVARFLSADAVVQDPTNGQSYNRYSYVFNNPTNMTDPTGFVSDPADEPRTTWKQHLNRACSGSIDILCVQRGMAKIGEYLQGLQAASGQKVDKNPGEAGSANSTPATQTYVGMGTDGVPYTYEGPAAEPKSRWQKIKEGAGDFVEGVLHAAEGIPGEGVVVGGISRLGRAAYAAEKAAEACCCFPAGTPVVTENGATPIEQIRVGQLVRARDEKTGLTELKPVTKLFITRGKALFKLTTRSAGGVIASLEVTDNHPFWVEGKGWTESAQLLPGMVLKDVDNAELSVVDLHSLDRTETTFNFTVADFHTYFAGPQKAFVHNACKCVLAAEALAKNERALWQMTSEGTAKVMQSEQFGKVYKSASDGLWWSKDLAGHGDSAWKVFRETSKGLEWVRDADKYGNFMYGKHKGDVGTFIPWNRLFGGKF